MFVPSKKILIFILSIISAILIAGVLLYLTNISKNNSINKVVIDTIIPKIHISPEPEEPKVTSKKLPILIYHYVEINQDKRDTIRDSLNINPYVFEQQVLTLKNAGYKFIWPSEINEFLNDKSDTKYVMITFDDGYGTFYSQTYPFIKKHNLKVTNYLIAHRLGFSNYMTKSQVHSILKDGLVELGSHTLNHPDLRSLSVIQLQKEISDSKIELEKEFGVSITSFCYPYGYYNSNTIPYVMRAGYTTAVTTREGTIFNSDNLFEIKRFRTGYLTGQALLNKIENNND